MKAVSRSCFWFIAWMLVCTACVAFGMFIIGLPPAEIGSHQAAQGVIFLFGGLMGLGGFVLGALVHEFNGD